MSDFNKSFLSPPMLAGMEWKKSRTIIDSASVLYNYSPIAFSSIQYLILPGRNIPSIDCFLPYITKLRFLYFVYKMD